MLPGDGPVSDRDVISGKRFFSRLIALRLCDIWTVLYGSIGNRVQFSNSQPNLPHLGSKLVSNDLSFRLHRLFTTLQTKIRDWAKVLQDLQKVVPKITKEDESDITPIPKCSASQEINLYRSICSRLHNNYWFKICINFELACIYMCRLVHQVSLNSYSSVFLAF
jgi:hypothetical protein